MEGSSCQRWQGTHGRGWSQWRPLAGRLKASSGVAIEKGPASMVDTGAGRKEEARRIEAGVHGKVQATAWGSTAAAMVDSHGPGSGARAATTRLGMAQARRERWRGAFSVHLNHLGSKAHMATEAHVVFACCSSHGLPPGICSRGHMSPWAA